MYGVWLAKQTTGWCATRRNMSRIMDCLDDKCPNCLVGPERSTHLNTCKDPGHTHQFNKDIDDLHQWMRKTTDPELCYWIIQYLLLCGERTMLDLGKKSPAMTEIAKDLDMIGWTDVLHGRLPHSLHRYQSSYCAT